MAHECRIIEEPTQATVYVRTRTPVQNLPKVLGEGFAAVATYLGQIGEPRSGPPYVAYHNMDMQDLDVEIGFPVSRSLPGKEAVVSGEIPGGRFATCLYTGPYPEMPPAYEALTQLVKDKGLETTGLAIESYLNDPTDTAPEALKTLIRFPLR